MRVLLIAPLPPPITGHSLAAQVLLEHLRLEHDVEPIDLSVGSSSDGTVSWSRIKAVLKVLILVWRRQRSADVIYLTISESVAGNLKDLFIYLLCSRRLRSTYVHLHGGSLKKLLFDRYGVLRRLNRVAISRLAGVIVSGPSHRCIFADMIALERIHIVTNFALDELFVPENTVVAKFADTTPLRVLYVSGMTDGKGYLDLADAWTSLDPHWKERVQIDFAGRFDSPEARAQFVERIAGRPGIRYHGLVDSETKRELFAAAHVFCLPTSMFEGQPLSILEAYASGCVVVATGQDGIRDVFTHGVNGTEIDPRSPASIARALERLGALGTLASIGAFNRRLAEEQFRASRFNGEVAAVLGAVPREVSQV